MVRYTSILFFLFVLALPQYVLAGVETVSGVILDKQTGEVVAGAKLHSVDDSTVSDQNGAFLLATDATTLIVRKAGYLPQQVTVSPTLKISLQPFTPKGLYLSYWAADSHERRNQIQQLIAKTGMNSLVIDLKSSRGDISFRCELPLAIESKAQRARTLKDLPDFLRELKQQGIYTIGRIVVFKDNRLARNRHDLAIHTLDGYLWEDREKLSWVDPFSTEVWDYNIAIAKKAAALGFDEIQFDYIRFPAKSDLIFLRENTGENRVAAINGFLHEAKQQLANYPVMISANIFGYLCWKPQDQKIGQQLVKLAENVDYLSPMLYPSGFPYGVPGYNNPVQHPYQIISHSLQQAIKLSGLPAVSFRPWLQAFRDYAFDRRNFEAADIQAQINASDATGSHGWMLWNASSRYSLAGLQQTIPLGKRNLVDVSPKDDTAIISKTAEPPFSYPPL